MERLRAQPLALILAVRTPTVIATTGTAAVHVVRAVSHHRVPPPIGRAFRPDTCQPVDDGQVPVRGPVGRDSGDSPTRSRCPGYEGLHERAVHRSVTTLPVSAVGSCPERVTPRYGCSLGTVPPRLYTSRASGCALSRSKAPLIFRLYKSPCVVGLFVFDLVGAGV